MGKPKVKSKPGKATKGNVKPQKPAAKAVPKSEDKRSYLSQTDVPGCGIHEALRVPKALRESYAGGPATPLQVASALDMTPTSGPFRALCGASIAYGLTDGGYNAQQIELTGLGKRIVAPLQEGDDLQARREAVLKPRVLGEFLKKYSGSPLPREDIAQNVLESMGVPKDRTIDVYALITSSARAVGFLTTIKNKDFVDLAGTTAPATQEAEGPESEEEDVPRVHEVEPSRSITPAGTTNPTHSTGGVNRRVFVTHGKNTSFIEHIKKLLSFGELTPVISAEKQTVSKPVPDKVMEDMRSCGAAIIHVDDELKLMDAKAEEHVLVNSNVLIEIGASMALYGRRFILLVKDGIKLPSNLQGLYEVRYRGDGLDAEATIKLLEAINDIKNNPLPTKS